MALAAVLTLLIGGGAFAFYRLDPFHVFRPGPQPAEAVPSVAIGYVSVDLDPMAEQKVDAVRFLNAFPGFRQRAGVSADDDVRENVLMSALHSEHCSGIRYARDVEPWLGERFGLAFLPSTPQDKDPYTYVVQVSNQTAARQGVAKIVRQCSAGSLAPAQVGVAFSHGFMLLAPSQRQADSYARAAEGASLADSQEFRADMASLGDPGIVSAWVDLKGLIRSVDPGLLSSASLQGALRETQRLAATFRFRSDAVEVEASMYGDNVPVAHGYNPIVKLPPSTVFAMSESGGGERVDRAWSQTIARLRTQDPRIDEQLKLIQRQTGLLLPADLRTLLGQNVLFAMDRQGLGSATSANNLDSLDLGARLTGDPTKLNALYARVMRLVGHGQAVHLPVTKKTFADGVTIASNPRYAEELGRLDGHLGSSPDFTSVVGDAASEEFVLYFDFDSVQAPLLRELRSEGAPLPVLNNLRPVRALGITADVEGRYQQTTMRLSID